MKATAGLHRPFPSHGQHGFVNLAAAAVAAMAAGAGEEMLTAILDARGSPSLRLSRDELIAGGVSLDAAACALRENLLTGIGSCSFDEPVADLTALGILPL